MLSPDQQCNVLVCLTEQIVGSSQLVAVAAEGDHYLEVVHLNGVLLTACRGLILMMAGIVHHHGGFHLYNIQIEPVASHN